MRASLSPLLPFVVVAAGCGNGGGGDAGSPPDLGAATVDLGSLGADAMSGDAMSSDAMIGDATSSDATSSDSMSGDATAGPACPPSSCVVADKTCLALTDNSTATKLGLRAQQIDFAAPPAFTAGLVSKVFGDGALPNLPSCSVMGAGTFNLLLQFDTAAGSLTVGGAKPVADPTQGYSFVDQTFMQRQMAFHVAPVTSTLPVMKGGPFAQTTGADLVLPIYLNASATQVVLLPIRQARFTTGMLSTNGSCIGSFNPALDPTKGCMPGGGMKYFLDGGSVDGYVTLEDADQVDIAALNETLCVLLSGNASMYGTGGADSACKRDSSTKIIFRGDWCAMTNAAATASCADAVQVKFSYAAGAVKIL